jgi:Methyltransferase domain
MRTFRVGVFDRGRRVRGRFVNERAGYNYAAHSYPALAGVYELQPDMHANPLAEFFDMQVHGRGIHKWRHYFEIYHRHFAKFRGQPVTVLEIGVESGGSLEMWKEYFAPDCHIHGLDVNPACKEYEDDRVTIHIGDQADPAFWRGFVERVPELDVIVDDGGHETPQQVVALEALLPHVRPNGVYLCEDAHDIDNRFHDYVCGLARNLHSMSVRNTFRAEIQAVHLYPWVAVIEKRAQRLVLSDEQHGTEWRKWRPVDDAD